nr:hypothetical protein [Tanacetum cinerariifolium]
ARPCPPRSCANRSPAASPNRAATAPPTNFRAAAHPPAGSSSRSRGCAGFAPPPYTSSCCPQTLPAGQTWKARRAGHRRPFGPA